MTRILRAKEWAIELRGPCVTKSSSLVCIYIWREITGLRTGDIIPNHRLAAAAARSGSREQAEGLSTRKDGLQGQASPQNGSG